MKLGIKLAGAVLALSLLTCQVSSYAAGQPKGGQKSGRKEAPGKSAKDKKDGSKKPITIVSDRMDSESEKNNSVVLFSGNVVAEEDFILCSDRLTVRYGEDKEISEITAKGNVVILKEEKTAVSENAVYNKGTRVVVLTGNAIVKQAADTVRGERISFNLDQEKATVEGGASGRVRVVITPQDKKAKDAAAQGTAQTQAPGKDLAEKVSAEEARCRRAHEALK